MILFFTERHIFASRNKIRKLFSNVNIPFSQRYQKSSIRTLTVLFTVKKKGAEMMVLQWIDATLSFITIYISHICTVQMEQQCRPAHWPSAPTGTEKEQLWRSVPQIMVLSWFLVHFFKFMEILWYSFGTFLTQEPTKQILGAKAMTEFSAVFFDESFVFEEWVLSVGGRGGKSTSAKAHILQVKSFSNLSKSCLVK